MLPRHSLSHSLLKVARKAPPHDVVHKHLSLPHIAAISDRINQRPEVASNGEPRLISRSQRLGVISSRSFVPWLTRHIELSAKVQDDVKLQKFLNKLALLLKTPAVSKSLSEDTTISPNAHNTTWRVAEHKEALSLLKALQDAYIARGAEAVDAQLRYAYHGVLAGRETAKVDKETLNRLTDLRYPLEWYDRTRELQRVIHLHVGPTNSGKTYTALKALEKASTGIYAGPLRLLAHEVYARMNAMGKDCDLYTGDERIVSDRENANLKSATVEMVPLDRRFDVAVIDEIQMIGDQHRGWAWTRALLGLRAKQIHLCGEERVVPLIHDLVAWMGDELKIHTYKRLSPLKMMTCSLEGDLRNLRKGDCVVAFSKIKLYALKSQIEILTGRRVAIVYGTLPPEVRAQQAALFNDPDNDYDYLVATDAIGMGLNL